MELQGCPCGRLNPPNLLNYMLALLLEHIKYFAGVHLLLPPKTERVRDWQSRTVEYPRYISPELCASRDNVWTCVTSLRDIAKTYCAASKKYEELLRLHAADQTIFHRLLAFFRLNPSDGLSEEQTMTRMTELTTAYSDRKFAKEKWDNMLTQLFRDIEEYMSCLLVVRKMIPKETPDMKPIATLDYTGAEKYFREMKQCANKQCSATKKFVIHTQFSADDSRFAESERKIANAEMLDLTRSTIHAKEELDNAKKFLQQDQKTLTEISQFNKGIASASKLTNYRKELEDRACEDVDSREDAVTRCERYYEKCSKDHTEATQR